MSTKQPEALASTPDLIILPSGNLIQMQGDDFPLFFDGAHWKPFYDLTPSEVQEISNAHKSAENDQYLLDARFWLILATSPPEEKRRLTAMLRLAGHGNGQINLSQEQIEENIQIAVEIHARHGLEAHCREQLKGLYQRDVAPLAKVAQHRRNRANTSDQTTQKEILDTTAAPAEILRSIGREDLAQLVEANTSKKEESA